MKLLQTLEDMQWLRDTHLPYLPGLFLSATISGNEDCPLRIDCYMVFDPSIHDKPVTFWLVDGVYIPFYD